MNTHATRQLDKALMDRFTIIEMDILTDEEEFGLLKYMFPTVDESELKNISDITHLTRVEAGTDNPRITSGVSTRTSVEIAGLLFDGFSLMELTSPSILSMMRLAVWIVKELSLNRLFKSSCPMVVMRIYSQTTR